MAQRKTIEEKRATKNAWYAKNKQKANRKQHAWYAKNNLLISLRPYKLTPAQYEEMAREQGFVCAISGLPPGKRRLVVDHHHASGVNRGLLHHSINAALGLFQDNPEWLERAAAYLRARSPR